MLSLEDDIEASVESVQSVSFMSSASANFNSIETQDMLIEYEDN